MANVNISPIVLSNTFDHWRIVTNNLANSLNELRNGNYYKDGGNLTLANGSINLINGSGTLLSVSGNATVSQRLTTNTIVNSSDITVQGNNALFTGNSVIVEIANTARAKNLVSNTQISAANVNVAGYIHLSGNLTPQGPVITEFNQRAVLSVNNQFMVSNTGNTVTNGSIRLINANNSFNVAGNANVVVDLFVGGNGSFGGNVTIGGAIQANSLNVHTITALNGRINTLSTWTLTLDPTATYGIANGNAVLNNLTVTGTTTTTGSVINSADEYILRFGLASDGVGRFTVARGTGNGNASIRFQSSNNVWQAASNNQQTFFTIITTANVVDNFTNTSTIHVASANAVNAAYNAAIVNATAIVANNGVFVAQRKGINIIAGNNMSLNISANGANTQLTDVRLTSTVSVVDSITSTSNNSAASANAVNWLRTVSVQKSGDSMTGNLAMGNNEIQNATVRAGREAYSNIVLTSATHTINLASNSWYDILMVGNKTVTFQNAGPTGTVTAFSLVCRQTANGGNNMTFSNTIRWSDNVTPVFSTLPNVFDVFYFVTFTGGSLWYGSQVMANVPVS